MFHSVGRSVDFEGFHGMILIHEFQRNQFSRFSSSVSRNRLAAHVWDEHDCETRMARNMKDQKGKKNRRNKRLNTKKHIIEINKIWETSETPKEHQSKHFPT